MKSIFDEFIERRNTGCIKWENYDEDVIPMWVADMDFPSPEPIVQALLRRVEHRFFGYPCDDIELKEAIVYWLAKRHDWEISMDDIMLIPGVISGFNLVSHAMTNPGDAVLLQTPAYPPFFSVAKNVHLKQQEMELSRSADGSYSVDMQRFMGAVDESTKLFMLCNPHNPTGRVFQRDELKQMAEICLKNDIVICADEIHHDLVYSESKHIPIASLSPEISKNTITLFAPSKTFNIAGLTSSVLVCSNPETREKLAEAKQGLMGWVNILGQTATKAAYQDGHEWLDDLLVYLEGNRDLTYEFVNSELPGAKMAKPEGTYLAWIDCREANLEPSPYEFFLQNARVGLNDGARFGQSGEGFVRLNYGCPRQVLEEGLERMKKALVERSK